MVLILILVGSGRTARQPIEKLSAKDVGQNTKVQSLQAELNRLGALFSTRAYAEACAGYERVFSEAAQVPDSNLRRRATWGVGGCRLIEGRYEESLQLLLSVRTMLEGSGEEAALAAIHVNLGTLYQEAGDLASAEVSLREAAGLAERAGSPYLAQALVNLGAVEVQSGSSAAALEHLRAGMEEADRSGQQYLTAMGLDWMSLLFLKERRFAEAERVMLESYRIRRLCKYPYLEIPLQNLGMLRLEQGDLRSAASLLEGALHPGQPGRAFLQWPYFLARARLKQRTGRPGPALNDLRTAVELLRNRRAQVPAADALRMGFEGKAQGPYLALAEASADAWLAGGVEALKRESFEAVEENRASSLAARAREKPWWQLSLGQEYWRLSRELRELEQRALDGDRRARGKMARVRTALLEQEAAAGLAGGAGVLASGRPSLAGGGLLRATRGTIGDGDAFFTFLLGEKCSYRWTATRQDVGLTRLLGRDEIVKSVTAFSDAVRRDDIRARELGRQLYRQLFGGLPAEVKRRHHWMVSLDDALFEAPLAALVTGDGSFLAEHYAVETVPGASLYARSPRTTGGGSGFVGVGDPVYNRADGRRQMPWFRPVFWNVATNQGSLARLPASSGELRACARALGWRSRMLLGSAARLDAVRQAAESRPTVLHFATHVVADGSGGAIALSLSESGRAETLSSAEIERWNVPGALVVLSGCRSGSGAALPGTGVLGLTRAWMMAGARAVLASRWATADEAGELFESFYRHFAAGAEPAEALRRAQTEALRKGGWRARPSYWAAYFVTGANRGAGPERNASNRLNAGVRRIEDVGGSSTARSGY